MNLQPGTKVGRYEIVSFIGAGGMGQVYRARDAQLAREVAVKLLPANSVGKPQIVARFQQEARSLGLLNHPNLVTVYDFGTYEDSFFIVLELLQGQTLRERLNDGRALSQRKAIRYAIEIARGMAAAHDRGVIHRDLKPENIFLTQDGGLKVLDFGLAKMNPALNSVGSDDDSPTLVGGPFPGAVIGTVGYISPEQLQGDEVDHRADIFAFGGILYEMLARRRAFEGTTAVATLSAVLKDDPAALQDLGVSVLPGLDLIMQRCLEKRPQSRFQSAHDLSLALEALGSSTDSMTVPFRINVRANLRRFRKISAYAALAICAAVAGALLWSRSETGDPPAYRQLTFRRGDISAARFTPDGGIVYSASWEGGRYEIYSARTDSIEGRSLGIASNELLAVSHTGDLALLVKSNQTSGTLAVVSLSGGAPRELVSSVVAADWSPDGSRMAVARRLADGRYQIEYPIGKSIYQGATRIRDLRVSPDGKSIAFRLREARLGKDFDLMVIDVDSNRSQKLGDWTNAKGLAWAPNGRSIVFASSSRGSTEIRTTTSGGKTRLLTRFDGSVKLHDVSRDGDLLLTRDDYRESILARTPGAERERDLSWFDGSGASDISPDGRLLLMSEFGEAGGSHYSAYVRPTNGGPAVRLGDGYGVSLSPDGTSALVIVPGATARLAIVPLGAGETRFLAGGDVEDYEFGAWLPDGQAVVFTGRTAKTAMRLYRQDVHHGGPVPIGPPGLHLAQASRPVSPDGKLLAVRSDDGSIVLLHPDGTGPLKTLLPGANFVPIAWADDGHDLFVGQESEFPARLDRLNVETGQIRHVRELMPADAAGVSRVMDIVITPDGRAYAYGVLRNLSTLFFSTGWRKRLGN